MQTLMKILVLLFCINMFVYVGGNYEYMVTGNEDDKPVKVSGDLIDVLMDSRPTTLNSTRGAAEFNSNLSQPEQAGGELIGSESSGGVSFLDQLRIVWSIIPTLFNVATAGITIFFISDLPPIIGLLVGIPLNLIFLLAIFAFIRGVGD